MNIDRTARQTALRTVAAPARQALGAPTRRGSGIFQRPAPISRVGAAPVEDKEERDASTVGPDDDEKEGDKKDADQAVQKSLDNSDAVTPANNDTGTPTTPSENDPSLPTPSDLSKDRDEEEDVAELGHGTSVKEGAGMEWLDQLGS